MIKRILLGMAILLGLALWPGLTAAQTNQCADGYELGVPLPGLKCVPKGEGAFAAYVVGLYRYVVGLAVILAAIVITWGGYLRLTSGGDPSKVTHGNELIVGALSGLALLLLAATILRWIGIGGGGGTGSQPTQPPTQQQPTPGTGAPRAPIGPQPIR
jgi:hypothetical protein